VMMMDGFLLNPVRIVVVGVVISFHVVNICRVFDLTVTFRARALSLYRVAFGYLSRHVIFLNLMGWRIGSSCYWVYAIHFWALVQSIIILVINIKNIHILSITIK
jgi:hypothetical protein